MRDRAQDDHIPGSAVALGLAGLLPFVAAVLSQWMEIPAFPQAHGLSTGIVYGASILSFLGGIRWGTAMASAVAGRQAMEFLASGLPVLAGLLAFFMPPVLAVILLIAGFLTQGLWDTMSVESGRLPQWFGRLRMGFTAGAVVTLLALLLRLLI